MRNGVDGSTLRVSVLRNVDLTRELVPTCDHEQAAQRNVLTDHESEFCNLGVLEVLAQLCFECRIHRSEVGREPFCKAHGKCVSGFEIALLLGQMNLSDRFFIESLTRRRRVAGEQSGVTLVEGRDLEAGEFLDP